MGPCSLHVAATQTAEEKQKKRKRVGLAVSVDTTTVSFDIETINVEEEEDDAWSPSTATVPPAKMSRKATVTKERATETPRRAATMEERSRSGADALGDAGSQKRAKKPPNPIKPGLRSATK
jgi:hypothetical protein